jgi:hypothetical protein
MPVLFSETAELVDGEYQVDRIKRSLIPAKAAHPVRSYKVFTSADLEGGG